MQTLFMPRAGLAGSMAGPAEVRLTAEDPLWTASACERSWPPVAAHAAHAVHAVHESDEEKSIARNR